jgi:Sec-independent protein secretion pathway component TatC
LIAAAVFSHWILDALVHRPEMPVAGSASAKVGLGLWDRMPIALLIEAAIVVFGLALFLRRSNLSRQRSIALVILTSAILLFTGIGMTLTPPPPSATAMAASSLITLIVIAALYGWIGRAPRAKPVWQEETGSKA